MDVGEGLRLHLGVLSAEAGSPANAPFRVELLEPSDQAFAGAVRHWNGRATACASASAHDVVGGWL
eukprot:9340406-Pyramimonas_sp.AAC.2